MDAMMFVIFIVRDIIFLALFVKESYHCAVTCNMTLNNFGGSERVTTLVSPIASEKSGASSFPRASIKKLCGMCGGAAPSHAVNRKSGMQRQVGAVRGDRKSRPTGCSTNFRPGPSFRLQCHRQNEVVGCSGIRTRVRQNWRGSEHAGLEASRRSLRQPGLYNFTDLSTAQCSSGIRQSRPFPARPVKIMESASQITRESRGGRLQSPRQNESERAQQSASTINFTRRLTA